MRYSIAQKNHFISLLRAGKEVKTIKEEDMAHVNLSTLHRWKKQFKTEGHLVAKKPTGRPPKFTDREIRHLIRVAKTNKDLSIKKIAEAANLDASHKTVVKILKTQKLQSSPLLKKPKQNS
jgi:transposase